MKPAERLKLCFPLFVALSPNCWSALADKTSDRYGSLSVCSVLPTATADEEAQREVQVRCSLFARPSITGFLIRLVEESAAGGRLYGHHHPTHPLLISTSQPSATAYGSVATASHLRCVSNGCPLPSHKPLAVDCLIVSEIKINIWRKVKLWFEVCYMSYCNICDADLQASRLKIRISLTGVHNNRTCHCHYKKCSLEQSQAVTYWLVKVYHFLGYTKL